jgi:hypothetical protein
VNKLEKFRLFKTTAQESYKSLQDFHCNRLDPTYDHSTDNKFGLLEIQVLESRDDRQQQAHVKLEIEAEVYQFTDTDAGTSQIDKKRDQVTDSEVSDPTTSLDHNNENIYFRHLLNGIAITVRYHWVASRNYETISGNSIR